MTVYQDINIIAKEQEKLNRTANNNMAATLDLVT